MLPALLMPIGKTLLQQVNFRPESCRTAPSRSSGISGRAVECHAQAWLLDRDCRVIGRDIFNRLVLTINASVQNFQIDY